jgi:hypothetical protein
MEAVKVNYPDNGPDQTPRYVDSSLPMPTRNGGGYDPDTDGYDVEKDGPTYNPDQHPGMPLNSPSLKQSVLKGEK